MDGDLVIFFWSMWPERGSLTVHRLDYIQGRIYHSVCGNRYERHRCQRGDKIPDNYKECVYCKGFQNRERMVAG